MASPPTMLMASVLGSLASFAKVDPRGGCGFFNTCMRTLHIAAMCCVHCVYTCHEVSNRGTKDTGVPKKLCSSIISRSTSLATGMPQLSVS